MYIKDFDGWNNLKKQIHNEKPNRFYHRQEIWWCSLGLNIGFEHDGAGVKYQRPVLILKGLSPNTCLVAPLTSSTYTHPLRIPIGFVADRKASVVISQIRIIDTKRLTERICFMNKETFESVRKAVKDML
jgi:mRNA-degrading endonuclease toxin of MazEF toxin-antitoxin module